MRMLHEDTFKQRLKAIEEPALRTCLIILYEWIKMLWPDTASQPESGGTPTSKEMIAKD